MSDILSKKFYNCTMEKTNAQKIALGQDEMLTAEEAARFTKFQKSWLYQLVFARKIPVYHVGRKLLFSKLELSEWLIQERRKTLAEISTEAAAHTSAR